MPGELSWDRLRELAAYRAQHGCAVSLFVNLDPSEVPTPGDVAARVTPMLHAAERGWAAHRPDPSPAERLGLRADLERIGAWLETSFDRSGAQGAAVFAAGADGVFDSLFLNEPVPDSVRVGRTFSLTPLVPLVGRADAAIVAVVGREQGHLYRLMAGRLAELADLQKDQPRRHDQGGRSQARLQRHVDGLAEEHLRDVANELTSQVRRSRGTNVVVVGAEETRAQFIELLPSETRTAIVGGTQAEAHAGPTELLEAAAPILNEARALRERNYLARWRDESARGGRAAGGWEDTLEAASDARVELLLFRGSVEHSAFQCPSCGRASAHDDTCPLDGARMERADGGVDLAVQQTLTHGGSVLAVERAEELESAEGIGALLRF